MNIEIWSDIACPFCYIGKKRFEKAISSLSFAQELNIVWRSYQLSPDIITTPGHTVIDYLVSTKGITHSEALQMNAYVKEMAEGEDLHFDFEKIQVANTRRAHKLIQFVKQFEQQHTIAELLFHAYFIEGKNVDEEDVLLSIAEKAGIAREPAATALASDGLDAAVEADIYEAFQLGIKSVPFFVINRAYGVVGAQATEVFVQTLEKAYAEQGNANAGA